MKKILIPMTNHATLGTTSEANGTFSPELTHALAVFLEAGFAYDLATIHGGAAPLYGTEIEGDEVNTRINADATFQSQITNTKVVSALDISQYDAVYYPGGFGLLSDLATNEDFGKLSAQHYEAGGVIGAVCHGPGALLPITLSSGEKLIANKAVTGFTREEEVDYGTIDNIPFLLEESLARNAGEYRKVQPWNVFVVQDERLVTGQNPASAHAVAKTMVDLL